MLAIGQFVSVNLHILFIIAGKGEQNTGKPSLYL